MPPSEYEVKWEKHRMQGCKQCQPTSSNWHSWTAPAHSVFSGTYSSVCGSSKRTDCILSQIVHSESLKLHKIYSLNSAELKWKWVTETYLAN